MKPARRSKPSSDRLISQGKESFRAGRFYLAAEAFAKARETDPKNPVVLFNLASAKERIGEIDEAAQLLTEALRLRPAWFEAAQRLALICGRYRIENAGELNPHGLLAAFAFDRIDRQVVASAAIAHLLAQSSLGEATESVASGEADETARDLILRRTDKSLSQPLLLAALTAAPNRNPEFERLLTALRRVLLLEIPAERFEDKALTAFAIALIRQCLLNEHIFSVTSDEHQALGKTSPDLAELLAGAPDQSRRLMLHLLYRPPETLIGKALTAAECRSIRPRALGELLMSWLADSDSRAILAADLPVTGRIEDDTSRKVAGQYETHPYPRWDSLQLPQEGSARAALARFFEPDRLSFLDRPLKVLIAGAGTGQQAIAAATRYGPAADVLAIDLSRQSLAYAKMKAEQFEIANLRFAQADLQNLTADDGLFEIIEAVGVLHHMAEPFQGWKTLAGLLRPGGLMLVGLYSAVARQNITNLRSEADYPGPDCDDETARSLSREVNEPPRRCSGIAPGFA